MKKFVTVSAILLVLLIFVPGRNIHAQDPITEIIKAAVVKAIKAVDLKIQRLQNKTIWLQNAQKTLENKMSELKLTEISSWIEKQRKLYANYFDELWKVKAAFTTYYKVKEIIESQLQIVKEYKASWELFKKDGNFSPDELDYFSSVYTGIFETSLKNLDQLSIVFTSFTTQMSDAKRKEIIDLVAGNIQENLHDLRDFNTQNRLMSLQRASEKGELESIKKLYGL